MKLKDSCKKCGTNKLYNKKYDSYYCKKCNLWLEKKCGDSSCEFCSERPKTPFSI